MFISLNLIIFIFCISMMILVLFAVYRELLLEKRGNEFDELIMKSNRIEDKLLELYNNKKYKKHVFEYNENQKYINENDNEIIITNKSNIFLLKITKTGIEYKDFFRNKIINYDNIVCICDSLKSIGKGSMKGIIIRLKDSKLSETSNENDNTVLSKRVFIPWENGKNLPIRRKPLINKIHKFIENNNIKLAS